MQLQGKVAGVNYQLSSAETVSLPSLIDRAAATLSNARSSAEILEARDAAKFAYDVAKSAARLARAKVAHDDIIQAVYRAQADALEIEAGAKRRLADEYDAAQERGDVAKGRPKSLPDENTFAPTISDIGLTSKDIFEARQIRDAEENDPGFVRRILNEKIAAGEEPTRAAVTQAIVNRTSFTGNNQWFTPKEFLERARDVLGEFDLDPASHVKAQERVRAKLFFTEEDNGLEREWSGRVWLNPPYAQPEISYFIDKMTSEVASGRVSEAIMLTHNYTDTAWFQKAAKAATCICFTRGRIRFISPSGDVAAPTQGQAFFYFGLRQERFAECFADAGFIVKVKQ